MKKWEQPIQANFSLSPYLDEKNHSCSFPDSLDGALKHMGPKGSVASKLEISPAQPVAVYCSLDSQESSAAECGKQVSTSHLQCINQLVVSLHRLNQLSCLLFSHMRITNGKLQQTLTLEACLLCLKLHSFAKPKQGTFFTEYLS